jgi:integrase
MTYGEGSIFKSKDSHGRTKWKVEVTTGHKPDGSRIRTRRTVGSYAAAVALRRQLVADRDEHDLSFENPTLDTFALWWIREVRALKVKPATASDYEYRYRKMISPTLGNVKLQELDSRRVSSWVNALLLSYAQDSVNGALGVLKMVMSAAVEDGYCRKNPAKSIPKVSMNTSGHSASATWSADEARRAAFAAEEHWFGLPIVLAVTLGLRKGEILALKWSDVDFQSEILHVRRSRREYPVFHADGSSHMETQESDPKTKSSKRSIPIGNKLTLSLWNHFIQVHGGPFGDDEAYLVTARNGVGPMTSTVLNRGFKSFLHDNKLPVVRFHSLRHTAATMALADGVRIESVSQALGHSRIDTTKAIYGLSVPGLNSEFSESNQRQLSRDIAG